MTTRKDLQDAVDAMKRICAQAQNRRLYISFKRALPSGTRIFACYVLDGDNGYPYLINDSLHEVCGYRLTKDGEIMMTGGGYDAGDHIARAIKEATGIKLEPTRI